MASDSKLTAAQVNELKTSAARIRSEREAISLKIEELRKQAQAKSAELIAVESQIPAVKPSGEVVKVTAKRAR